MTKRIAGGHKGHYVRELAFGLMWAAVAHWCEGFVERGESPLELVRGLSVHWTTHVIHEAQGQLLLLEIKVSYPEGAADAPALRPRTPLPHLPRDHSAADSLAVDRRRRYLCCGGLEKTDR